MVKSFLILKKNCFMKIINTFKCQRTYFYYIVVFKETCHLIIQ